MFAHDTVDALVAAAVLVNTRTPDRDTLTAPTDVSAFLDRFGFTGRRDGSEAELTAVRDLRDDLRRAWDEVADQDFVVRLSNRLLAEAHASPWLTNHDNSEWHLHVTQPTAPLRDRLAAEAAMAFTDLIRAGELDRLRICAAPDCSAVLVDFTRNRSRRFCDTGNCGNRQHVAAYRARVREAG